MAHSPAEPTYGPLLVGYMLHMLLGGALCIQVYTFYVGPWKEKTWLTCFIAAVFVLNLSDAAALSYHVYDALILHYMDPSYLTRVTAALTAVGALTPVITIMVQLFFTWRVLVLTDNWPVVSVIVIFALGGFAAGMVSISLSHEMHFFAEMIRLKAPITVWMVCMTICDVAITTALVCFLRTHKPGMARTDALIDRIIRATIQTGMVTSILAMVNLFTYLFVPTGLHFAFNLVLPKLYCNTLLSSLNARGVWSESSESYTQSMSLRIGNGRRTPMLSTISPDILRSLVPTQADIVQLQTTSHPAEVMVTVEQESDFVEPGQCNNQKDFQEGNSSFDESRRKSVNII